MYVRHGFFTGAKFTNGIARHMATVPKRTLVGVSERIGGFAKSNVWNFLPAFRDDGDTSSS